MAARPRPLRRIPRLYAIIWDNSLVDHSMCFRRHTSHPESVEGNAKQQIKLGRGDVHDIYRFLVEDRLLAT